MKTLETVFGTGPDGTPVRRFALENGRGVRVAAINLGAVLTEVIVPDRSGRAANIVLGHDTVADYVRNTEFFGCIVGRFANRIAAGRFSLDGRQYALACNDGTNHTHGGRRGFDKVQWAGRLFRRGDAAGVAFTYTSADGEEGYPGTLRVDAEYVLDEAGELRLEYRAVTDRATPVNITNHSYWNLAGAGSGTVESQELAMSCPYYLPTDQEHCVTGEVLRTAGTPFDFSRSKPIGRDLEAVPGGFDHCMVMDKPLDALGHAATAVDPASGRVMEVFTTKPGFQFYTANFLDGRPFPKHGAFCLETQYFPNSPNVGHFPSCILRPGGVYHHVTVHRFSAR